MQHVGISPSCVCKEACETSFVGSPRFSIVRFIVCSKRNETSQLVLLLCDRIIDAEPFVVYVHEVWSEPDDFESIGKSQRFVALLAALQAQSTAHSVQTIQLPSSWF